MAASTEPMNGRVELHVHLDGSIPPAVTWRIMKKFDLAPVETLAEMKKLLQLQPEEEGSLLSYLDKFHYPMWITQFYENIIRVTEAIVDAAADSGVRILELRYSPVIHTFAGLTPVFDIDGRTVGQGKRGPMVERLQGLYQRLIEAECGSAV